MPNYQTKKGKISSKKPIPKISQKLLGMKNIKKKPVIKKNIGKMLETFSPAYSVMKGKGPISGALASLGRAAGPLSPIGMLAQEKRQAAKKRAMAMQGATPLASNKMPEMQKMLAGGPLKRTRSIDGCAKKGKTRAI
tara:strand:- start:183 stop:593 length:411 start_codon:yes stop_codon:yes gene_type:complete